MRKRFVLAAIIFVAAATIHADSPFAGTWRLNVAKSIGPNQPKELIAVVTEKGDQIETVMKGIAAEGRPISIRYTSSIKGGVVKFLEGRPPANITVTMRNVNWRSHASCSFETRRGNGLR